MKIGDLVQTNDNRRGKIVGIEERDSLWLYQTDIAYATGGTCSYLHWQLTPIPEKPKEWACAQPSGMCWRLLEHKSSYEECSNCTYFQNHSYAERLQWLDRSQFLCVGTEGCGSTCHQCEITPLPKVTANRDHFTYDFTYDYNPKQPPDTQEEKDWFVVVKPGYLITESSATKLAKDTGSQAFRWSEGIS